MANLRELREKLTKDGYDDDRARAKVCQDIVLKAIARSGMANHVTVKGGLVMQSVSGDRRRATRDMDLDFIRYSLDDDSIRAFIKTLNRYCPQGVTIEIDGAIEELSQQEYRGKRVNILLSDEDGKPFRSKIDLGVHANLKIAQEEHCFDVCLDDEGASLLMNSKEQIFTEKLKSLLIFGVNSTRYKDVFDLCFLSDKLDSERLRECMDAYIYQNPDVRRNDISAVRKRVSNIFRNRGYRMKLNGRREANWLEVNADEAFRRILDFLDTLQ